MLASAGLLLAWLLVASPAAAGPLVINANSADPAPRAAWEAAVARFKRENADIQVELNVYDHESYKTAIRNWLTGAPPDVVFWFGGHRMRQFVTPGLLEDVTDLFTPEALAGLPSVVDDAVAPVRSDVEQHRAEVRARLSATEAERRQAALEREAVAAEQDPRPAAPAWHRDDRDEETRPDEDRGRLDRQTTRLSRSGSFGATLFDIAGAQAYSGLARLQRVSYVACSAGVSADCEASGSRRRSSSTAQGRSSPGNGDSCTRTQRYRTLSSSTIVPGSLL